MDLCPAFITLKYVKVFSKGEEGKKREELRGKKKKKDKNRMMSLFLKFVSQKKIPWATISASTSFFHLKFCFYFKVVRELPTSTKHLCWILLWNKNIKKICSYLQQDRWLDCFGSYGVQSLSGKQAAQGCRE